MLCWRRAKAADKLTLLTPGLRQKGGLSEGAAAGISAFHVLRDLRPVVLEAAKERYLVASAHLPFPGLGHLRAARQGYEWVPVDYLP